MDRFWSTGPNSPYEDNQYLFESEEEMNEQLTVYQTDHGEIKLSPSIIKKYLVNGQGQVTDQEVMMFLALCKYQKLNPFLREAYLVKYGSSAATIVTGKEVFTKRASKIADCAGWESGVTVLKDDGTLDRRTGTLVLPKETLVGGWCRVHRHSWKVPIEHEVSMVEFDKKQSSWKTMPATMIRKVAIVSALRDAFPEDFQGMYDSAEMPVDAAKLDDKPVKPVDDKRFIDPDTGEEFTPSCNLDDPELPWNKKEEDR